MEGGEGGMKGEMEGGMEDGMETRNYNNINCHGDI